MKTEINILLIHDKDFWYSSFSHGFYTDLHMQLNLIVVNYIKIAKNF